MRDQRTSASFHSPLYDEYNPVGFYRGAAVRNFHVQSYIMIGSGSTFLQQWRRPGEALRARWHSGTRNNMNVTPIIVTPASCIVSATALCGEAPEVRTYITTHQSSYPVHAIVFSFRPAFK